MFVGQSWGNLTGKREWGIETILHRLALRDTLVNTLIDSINNNEGRFFTTCC
jgi:hypothetical protein